MKKLFAIAAVVGFMIGCTDGGGGNDSHADSVAADKDSVMDATGTGSQSSSKDTASYERMPSKPQDSLNK